MKKTEKKPKAIERVEPVTVELLMTENRRMRETLSRIRQTAGAGVLDCGDHEVAVATFGLVVAHASRALEG